MYWMLTLFLRRSYEQFRADENVILFVDLSNSHLTTNGLSGLFGLCIVQCVDAAGVVLSHSRVCTALGQYRITSNLPMQLRMFQFSMRLAPSKRLHSRYFIYLGALFLSLWTLYDIASHRTISPVPVDLGSHIWAERASQVRESFLHAYRGYEQYAAPHDELRPLSKQAIDKWVLQYLSHLLWPKTSC
jgi:hypothetical protein